MTQEVAELIKKVGTGGYKDGSSITPGFLYHPIPFKEYHQTPVHKLNCLEEYRTLIENYDFKDKTVVDIGSSGGWFSFNISKVAKEVHAYEADNSVRAVTEQIRKDKGIDNLTFHADFTKDTQINADCCIMLNVHMWLVKQYGLNEVYAILPDSSC